MFVQIVCVWPWELSEDHKTCGDQISTFGYPQKPTADMEPALLRDKILPWEESPSFLLEQVPKSLPQNSAPVCLGG